MSSGTASAAVALALLFGPTAAVAAPPAPKVRASLSFYWIIDESSPQYRGRADAVLRDVHGHVIAHTSRKFRRAVVLEGTGWLRDGRAVMYERKVQGEHRFRIADRCGFSVTGCRLVPFRTAAVDPHVIKLGSRIYIPQLKGARLPDGTIHDGIFIATDRGHFRGKHVDLFVGTGPRGARPFIRRGYPSRSHVTVQMLESVTKGCQ